MRGLRALGADLREWFLAVVRRVRRTKAAPLLVRATAGALIALAFLVAAPQSMRLSGALTLAAVLGAGVALLPRTRVVTIAVLVVVLTWLVSSIAFDTPLSLWRTGVLAATLHLTHRAAALAAVLPYDAVVAREVLVRSAVRAGGVTVVTVGASLTALAAFITLPAERSVVGAVVGAGLAVGLLALMVRLVRN